jgi:hypothetical protein
MMVGATLSKEDTTTLANFASYQGRKVDAALAAKIDTHQCAFIKAALNEGKALYD